MKFLYFSIIILLSALTALAQQTDLQKMGFHGRIRSITTNYYSIQDNTEHPLRHLDSCTEWDYNSNGFITSIFEKDNKGLYKRILSFLYDDKNRIVETKISRSGIIDKIKDEYHDDDSSYDETYFENGVITQKISCHYVRNYLPIEKMYYSGTGNVVKKEISTYKFLSDGYWKTEVQSKKDFDSPDWEYNTIYEYYKNGKLIIHYSDRTGVDSEEYIYDSMGNLSMRKILIADEITNIEISKATVFKYDSLNAHILKNTVFSERGRKLTSEEADKYMSPEDDEEFEMKYDMNRNIITKTEYHSIFGTYKAFREADNKIAYK